jgi:DNA-binding LytR/AlgR family response regulator
MHVLIVEDDFIIASELEAVLTEAGAEIAGSCRNVAEALAVIETFAVSGIDGVIAAILDIRLGSETIAPVARALAAHGVPFVFYSGQVQNDPIRAEWPRSRIVEKPAVARAIVAAVAELRERR